MIISITGWIGCGKDTVADYLCDFHQFSRESFAGPLKDAVAAVFGWDRDMLEGVTKQARESRDIVDAWWAKRLDIPHLTPRWVLQNWGTDVIRKRFHEDIWIASLENRLRNNQNDIVISDCRFPNEIATIAMLGGTTIWIQRGPMPHWYDIAQVANKNNKMALNELKLRKVHASEYAWVGTQFDAVIENNASLAQLHSNINDLVRDLRVAPATPAV